MLFRLMLVMFLATFVSLSVSATPSGNDSSLKPVYALAERILGKKNVTNFIFKKSLKEDRDTFEISPAGGGKVQINGSSVIAVTTGLNWYLRYYGNSDISTCGTQVSLPNPLVIPKKTVRKKSPYKYGYYLNYCTYNYTMSFWDWERWEKELDWMALNGINLPLAMTGNMAVWDKTLRKLGYTQGEIDEFLCGPAYFAWFWMGNLQAMGGPLPKSWIDSHIKLQKKILARMKELGMKPVMPGFCGLVPTTLQKKFPNAKILGQGRWVGGFLRPSFLASDDPLFTKIAKIFYEEQKKLFGPCNYFSTDPFHEGGKTKGIDLKAAGLKIYSSMTKLNPGATWVLQGWGGNPHMPMLSGLKKDDVIILDLDCDNRPQWPKRKGWEGYPWIWCTIQNFGGNTGMFGRMNVLAEEPVKLLNSPQRGNLLGIGSIPEGIEQNPVIFELLFEMRWRDKSPDMKEWVNQYAVRRYGKDIPAVKEAWQILYKTVYSRTMKNGSQQGTTESVLCARPAEKIRKVSSWGTVRPYYKLKDLIPAWEKMLSVSNQLKNVDTYRYDLVDITRQVLADFSRDVHLNMMQAYKKHDIASFDKWSKIFIAILDAQDKILKTRSEFLLGKWIADARSWGENKAEKDLYEYNARTLITTWSKNNSSLHEYSHREWAGLIRTLYKSRWEAFIAEYKARLKGEKTQKTDYFNKMEKPWTEATGGSFISKPEGDSVKISQEIYNEFKSYF